MRRLVTLTVLAVLVVSSSAHAQSAEPDAGAAAGAAILGGIVGGLLGAGIDRRVHTDDRFGVIGRAQVPALRGHAGDGGPGGGRPGGKGEGGKRDGGHAGKGRKPQTQ